MRPPEKKILNGIDPLFSFYYNIHSVNQSFFFSNFSKCFTKDLMDSPYYNRKFTSWDIFAGIQTDKHIVNFSDLNIGGTEVDNFLDKST